MSGGKYGPLNETHRQVEKQAEQPRSAGQQEPDRTTGAEQNAARQAGEHAQSSAAQPAQNVTNELEDYENRKAEFEASVDERIKGGKIPQHDRSWEIAKWERQQADNELIAEAKRRNEAGDQPQQERPESSAVKETKEIENEPTNDAAMTPEQKARFDRLMGSTFREAGNEVTRDGREGPDGRDGRE